VRSVSVPREHLFLGKADFPRNRMDPYRFPIKVFPRVFLPRKHPRETSFLGFLGLPLGIIGLGNRLILVVHSLLKWTLDTKTQK
jgi:hypothetical protein